MYIIITHIGAGYPVGFATTSRASLYARGLVEAGCRVLIVCPGPSEYQNLGVLNWQVRGHKDGVEFEYASGTTMRGRTFLRQKWLVFKGLLTSGWRIRRLDKTDKVEALVIFSDKWIATVFYWIVAILCKAKYINERNEQPFYQGDHSVVWKVLSVFYTYSLYRLFDGAIVISDYLMQYMRKRMPSGAGLLKIPILVDVQEFSSAKTPAPIPGQYLAYCGSWIEAQDGIHILMRAFSAIQGEFPELKLVLIGDSAKVSSIPAYRSHAKELKIVERVVFTGFVERVDLLSYLIHASILVLAKPLSGQSQAAFPTKLGEYLATGKPVLVTKTGSIAAYLKDNYDIFLANPDDIDSFASRIRYILTHKEVANEVGRRGREAATRFFDYRENGKKIRAFIDQL